jgi:ribosome recycling factor
MNTQTLVVHKLMEILDDNTQQVPEGFYLEMCNQLKNLHVALPTPDELERKELAVRRVRNRLERRAAELNSLKEELNKSVQEYNKCVEKFKEKKRKLDQTVDRIQVREDFLKGREQLMEDFEDNMTLAELKRTLILAE